MWNDLEIGWQTSFERGWNAFKERTIPIGAAIVNLNNEVVSIGQNKIYVESAEPSQITNHNLAHAEINAILALRKEDHPDIRSYTLYTTTEPCPLCFGAIVMGNIRKVKFASRDLYAGATSLNSKLPYIDSKHILFEGPRNDLELYQTIIQTYFEFEKYGQNPVIESFKIMCPDGVFIAGELFKNLTLRRMADDNARIDQVYDYVYGLIQDLF